MRSRVIRPAVLCAMFVALVVGCVSEIPELPDSGTGTPTADWLCAMFGCDFESLCAQTGDPFWCDQVSVPEPQNRPVPDTDGDGIPDSLDNCPLVFNPGQEDCDGDAVGDVCQGPDCNGNEIPDNCDIARETSRDCQPDAVPDECQLVENDCDENSIPDDCDLADCPAETPWCDDCNENGVLDVCDIARETSDDCQLDGVPDECQLVENDCNDDDVPDECQLVENDCNENGTPDDCELSGNDCNENGVPDDCDVSGGTSNDCQPDNIPDECQLTDNDCNENGIPDECDIPGPMARSAAQSPDCNWNGTPDECEIPRNSNAPGGPWFCDADCDPDCNVNGIPDECDIDPGTSQDCQPDGVPDECQLAGNDCNQDGVPDDCQLVENDCNDNGIPDDCETAVFLSQPTQSGIGLQSDVDGADGFTQVLADDFVLSAPATINVIYIWGAYTPGNDAPEADDFDVVFYPDVDGQPGPTGLFSASDVPCARAKTSRFVYPSAFEYKFTLVLPSPVVLSPGTYWVEIYNDTPTTTDGFAWLYGNPDGLHSRPGLVYSRATPPSHNWMPEANGTHNLAIELRGGFDCDGNDTPDDCDLAGGAEDCNSNGVPDVCEGDCNDNGVADECDVTMGTYTDCNSNLIPDSCEPDCNRNGVPDDCDIAAGSSPDCNDNGTPDECELAYNDCNGNRIPDDCDIAAGTSPDSNGNGVPDECEADCNDNGVSDFLEEPTVLYFVQISGYDYQTWALDEPTAQDLHLPGLTGALLKGFKVWYGNNASAPLPMTVRFYENNADNTVFPTPGGLLAEYVDFGTMQPNVYNPHVLAFELDPPVSLPPDLWMEVSVGGAVGPFLPLSYIPPLLGQTSGALYDTNGSDYFDTDIYGPMPVELDGVACAPDCNQNGVYDTLEEPTVLYDVFTSEVNPCMPLSSPLAQDLHIPAYGGAWLRGFSVRYRNPCSGAAVSAPAVFRFYNNDAANTMPPLAAGLIAEYYGIANFQPYGYSLQVNLEPPLFIPTDLWFEVEAIGLEGREGPGILLSPFHPQPGRTSRAIYDVDNQQYLPELVRSMVLTLDGVGCPVDCNENGTLDVDEDPSTVYQAGGSPSSLVNPGYRGKAQDLIFGAPGDVLLRGFSVVYENRTTYELYPTMRVHDGAAMPPGNGSVIAWRYLDPFPPTGTAGVQIFSQSFDPPIRVPNSVWIEFRNWSSDFFIQALSGPAQVGSTSGTVYDLETGETTGDGTLFNITVDGVPCSE